MAELETVSGFNLAWPWLLVLLPVPWLLRALLKSAPQSGLQALKVPWYGLMTGSGSSRLSQPVLAAVAAVGRRSPAIAGDRSRPVIGSGYLRQHGYPGHGAGQLASQSISRGQTGRW